LWKLVDNEQQHASFPSDIFMYHGSLSEQGISDLATRSKHDKIITNYFHSEMRVSETIRRIQMQLILI